MYKSSWALIAALAVVLACPAGPARAGTARVPADVTATECLRGGGLLLVLWDGQGGWLKQCQGGTHDGETVV
ncbi:hypothetical protein AB0G32_37525 [Streptomyces sp. NPDC023723]|uniref:hypothetical protein n=1 Tax=Streptomyces sp. NPDC023723 TaxID=3154323 RepID=UPI0033E8AD7E